MYYYINDKFVNSNDASVPFSDGGFLYGDGLFETMRLDNRQIFLPLKHLSRLNRGLKLINLTINKTADELLNILKAVIKKNTLDSGIIRLMVTRGITENKIEGYGCPNIYISIKPFYEIPKNPVKVVYLDETKYPIIRFTPAIKSMNYLGNMLAKKDADKKGAFEPVFYNKQNYITECAIRNIFYIKDNILLTPSLDMGILSGVMRDTILSIAVDLDMGIKETLIDYNNINLMDESFISSTGIGLLPCYWDEWNSKFQWTQCLKKELLKRINNK